MAIPLDINGAVFEYPENLDENWGVNATGWAQAVTNGMLQMAGGTFPLIADVNFGPNFGLLSKYFETRSALPATTGTVRLSSADAGIAFRNNANNGNLILTTDAADLLLFNGAPVGTAGTLTNAHIFVGNASNIQADVAMSGDITITNAGVTTIGAGTVTNAKIIAAAAISVNKLAALSASQIVVSDASGFLTTISSPTLAEIAFVGGVTSAIQTQLNARVTSVSGTANQITSTGGTTPILAIANPLTTPGAMTSGGAIAMGNNKITGLANGTAATDAGAFGQIPVFTDWVAYTPTLAGFGTATSVDFYWQKIANTLHIRGTFKTGTVAASTASMTVPSGVTISTTRNQTVNTNSAMAGLWVQCVGANFSSAGNMGAGFFDGSTTDTLFFCRQGAAGSTFSKQNGTDIAGSTDFIMLDFNIAIS